MRDGILELAKENSEVSQSEDQNNTSDKKIRHHKYSETSTFHVRYKNVKCAEMCWVRVF